MENAIDITIQKFEQLFYFFCESGLDEIAQSWELLDDGVEVAIAFASGNGEEQIEAANQLARMMRTPSLPAKRLARASFNGVGED